MSTSKSPRYACILIDEAFKITVCNPEHELLLRKIIELLIPGKKIRELSFVDKENHGLVISDKNTIFDLYCTEEGTGEQFIVEVQVAPQESYRERMLSYATYPIHKQLATKIDMLMTTQLDINGYINYAEKKGREEGREEGVKEVAKRLRGLNVPIETISKGTGLSSEEIQAL